MEERKPTVAVIGTGLMGASLGLALLKRGHCDRVNGYDTDETALSAALEAGAISEKAQSIQEAVTDADLVFVATPGPQVAEVFAQADPHIPEHCVVSDMASVKTPVVAAVNRYPRGRRRFIGGHPIAGKESGGAESADAKLFESRTWVLTPSEESGAQKEILSSLIGKLGAHVVVMTPEDHDAALAVTSHLPQILASTLALFAVDATSKQLPLIHGPAFQDMTRIAGSPEDLWTEIIQQNRSEIARVLRAFIERLETIERDVTNDKWEEIRHFLSLARAERRKFPELMTPEDSVDR